MIEYAHPEMYNPLYCLNGHYILAALKPWVEAANLASNTTRFLTYAVQKKHGPGQRV